ncbi:MULTISPECIES: hypothetical protein [unclassified Streptomyces]|uniref:hypothetical protein n=1 Tax=unclassified Streptomyces TaxID=2593676 RepID=UPI00131A9128|nr:MULTISPECIES: hypothetical protein [unclassified Streptomyces]
MTGATGTIGRSVVCGPSDAAVQAGVRHLVKVSAGSAATGPDEPSVTHVPPTPARLRERAARAGVPEWIRRRLAELMDLYAREDSAGLMDLYAREDSAGLMDLYARENSAGIVAHDVECVTGHPPGTLARFVADHASTFGSVT